MRYTNDTERLIKNFCAIKKSVVNTTPELDRKIINDAAVAQKASKMEQPSALQSNVWRLVMQNRMTQYAAAAMIILVIIIGFIEPGRPIGASAAFAAAMDNLKWARTFSCTETFQMAYQDGEKHGKYLLKQKWMFKEPDRERHEVLTSPWPRYVGETTIMDYGERRQLVFRPVEKTATLYDMSSDYEVDDKTGEIRLTQLNTSLRDRLLKWSAGAVQDLGREKLDGRTVRKLQSHKDSRTTTVWIDPETNLPLQIELKWTDNSREPVLYTSIRIDFELDDGLFSLELPVGFTVTIDKSNWPDDEGKILARMRYISVACFVYANRHDDRFPGELTDLVKAGIITNEVFNKVLTAQNEPGGQAMIRYRPPGADVDGRAIGVILYEKYDQWPDDGIVVCFADGHCEIISDQDRFQELIK